MNLNFSMSPYFSKSVLNFVFRSGVLTAPTGLYVALYTSEIDHLSMVGDEVVGGGYARAACGPGAQWWGAPSVVESLGKNIVGISNIKPINFPQATADWGIIRGVSIINSASGAGDVLFYTRTYLSPFEMQITSSSIPLVILPGAMKLTWS